MLRRPAAGTLAARLIHAATAGPVARLEFTLADGDHPVNVHVERERFRGSGVNVGEIAYLRPLRLRTPGVAAIAGADRA